MMRFFVGGDNRARQQRSGNACISRRACSVTGAQGAQSAQRRKTALFAPEIAKLIQQGVLCILHTVYVFQNATIYLPFHTRIITQENASVFRTPTYRLGSRPYIAPYNKNSTSYDALFCWWGQQGSLTAKRKCLHFEASVQCDRGTGRTECAKAENRLIRARCCPHLIKKAQHSVARFLMWWGQQGSNL